MRKKWEREKKGVHSKNRWREKDQGNLHLHLDLTYPPPSSRPHPFLSAASTLPLADSIATHPLSYDSKWI